MSCPRDDYIYMHTDIPKLFQLWQYKFDKGHVNGIFCLDIPHWALFKR